MPQPMTNDEAAELTRLFNKATGLQLQLPCAANMAKKSSWITEFYAAVNGPYQTMLRDADPRLQHERIQRPWHD